ncbi:uncharacterized protein EI90DRAFT_1747341 [Cantharellus anzutake]|uniref:uncharacterized protein n=1 Tax=Cantharellus anzutake TaxID=1750568 RepID=UPI0019068B62|nr:uncharacterized protein EI90DRAFT_1747341 [Cantharellus anzutake]KAF8341521.1 hypothetical protein EI90DRAFT_1747341 [Cantharellus anzutake]
MYCISFLIPKMPQFILRSWGEHVKPAGLYPFRVEQLVFRTNEVYEIYHSFKALVNGDAGNIRSEISGSGHDLSQWKGKIDVDDLYLTGHSFGGATAFAVLRHPPPESFEPLPLKSVLALDPWVDPVPSPGPLPATAFERPPLAVINSEGFTLWKEHFKLLRDIVSHWKTEAGASATLMTIGTSCIVDAFN